MTEASPPSSLSLEALFVRRIRERLPIPFTQLVNMLSQQHRLKQQLHQEFLDLVQFLLTAPCWVQNNISDDNEKLQKMQTTAVDALVTLSTIGKEAPAQTSSSS